MAITGINKYITWPAKGDIIYGDTAKVIEEAIIGNVNHLSNPAT